MLLLPFCMLCEAQNGICFVNCACCICVYQIFMRTLYSVSKNELQRVLEEFGWMHRIAHSLSPLMRLFGLPSGCSLLWFTGNVVGMAYGAAIMIDEVEQGRLTRDEANLVNHHLGVSHSLLEDTMLFVAMGISFWWICLTRLVLAMVTVWTMRLKSILLGPR